MWRLYEWTCSSTPVKPIGKWFFSGKGICAFLSPQLVIWWKYGNQSELLSEKNVHRKFAEHMKEMKIECCRCPGRDKISCLELCKTFFWSVNLKEMYFVCSIVGCTCQGDSSRKWIISVGFSGILGGPRVCLVDGFEVSLGGFLVAGFVWVLGFFNVKWNRL